MKAANVLFVDNPVGTGYSYVTDNSAYTTNVSQIADDLLTLFQAFLQQQPAFQVQFSLTDRGGKGWYCYHHLSNPHHLCMV